MVEAWTRLVSLARVSLEGLQQQLADAVAVHEARLGALAAQIRDAVATASYPDAAAAEVTSAHREARVALRRRRGVVVLPRRFLSSDAERRPAVRVGL